MDFKNDVEVEESLKKINEDVKKELSEKRYNHSVGVMKKAEELAKIYGADVNKAKLVGLAHDIGKELSRDEKLEYAKNNHIEVDEIEKINVGLLHGKIGADICKRRYNFTEDMQNAIKYHTTGSGKKEMTLLEKIIFLADKIEENRSYKDEKKKSELEEIRELAKENLDLAVVKAIDNSLVYTIQKGELIHPDSVMTRNGLIIEWNLGGYKWPPFFCKKSTIDIYFSYKIWYNDLAFRGEVYDF